MPRHRRDRCGCSMAPRRRARRSPRAAGPATCTTRPGRRA
ncbi:6-phosphogluconate dehydrogenase,decarboxylating [Mycobacterium intracellulare subsp. intracellulare MTCC 9506]|uniref:6-phosphogluconate dehydrogenase,decarboxylating n=1 Tax=Mycobacterium indicus pranii (strain DSM 45239 / MTCC 9506) TaxID=1232724 RepID=J9WJN1_MYCIP|nr:6-phosphogluconate dehydrogenase,decarboxylating [Mycobacterium intracellulare subsp. intracellulare MTCC 9506]